MKRLHRLITVSFLGPFALTFFIVLFLLLMQFLWRYIDDLVGKGLDFKVIAELMAYASASLVPMALPLAILLSSLMTFGNMGEYYELTAMKASGISLQRIMFPLIILVFFISAGAFFFANNVMPFTNLKMKSLLYDVRQQRPELQIKEGEFYSGIDNYSIRVNRKDPENNMLFDIRIYDHTLHKGNISVTVADSGKMEITADKRNLLVTLWNGRNYTELEEDRRKRHNTYPQRVDIFDEQKILITLSGFGLQRTDENLFKNYYQMLTVSQLSHAADSLNAEMNMRNKLFQNSLLSHHYFKISETNRRAGKMLSANDSLNKAHKLSEPVKENFDSLIRSLDPELHKRVVSSALSYARSTMNYTQSTNANLKYERRNLRKHEIEWHRKFTLSAACLIFLFIGAPLGAIIRKGGLGMPAVISTVLFILYYIISLTGEKIVRESMVTSLQGMWLSSFILVVVGVFITYKATNDSSMFNVDTYVAFIRTSLGIDRKNMLDKKIYLSGKFNIIDLSRDSFRASLLSLSNQATECKKSFRSSTRIMNLFRNLIHARPDESLVQLIQSYNQFFDQVVMSKWFTIKYIRDRLQEFPVLAVPERHKLPTGRISRFLSIVILPVFLGHLLLYHISIRRTLSKLDYIAEKTKFLSESIENPSLLIDL